MKVIPSVFVMFKGGHIANSKPTLKLATTWLVLGKEEQKRPEKASASTKNRWNDWLISKGFAEWMIYNPLDIQTPKLRRYLDPKNIPIKHLLRWYDWMSRDLFLELNQHLVRSRSGFRQLLVDFFLKEKKRIIRKMSLAFWRFLGVKTGTKKKNKKPDDDGPGLTARIFRGWVHVFENSYVLVEDEHLAMRSRLVGNPQMTPVFPPYKGDSWGSY